MESLNAKFTVVCVSHACVDIFHGTAIVETEERCFKVDLWYSGFNMLVCWLGYPGVVLLDCCNLFKIFAYGAFNWFQCVICFIVLFCSYEFGTQLVWEDILGVSVEVNCRGILGNVCEEVSMFVVTFAVMAFNPDVVCLEKSRVVINDGTCYRPEKCVWCL